MKLIFVGKDDLFVCVGRELCIACLCTRVCVRGATHWPAVFVCRNFAGVGLSHWLDQHFAFSGKRLTESEGQTMWIPHYTPIVPMWLHQ